MNDSKTFAWIFKIIFFLFIFSLEIIAGNIFDKTSEDSLNESDEGSLEIKINPPSILPEMPASMQSILPDTLKAYDRPMTLDLKGSVSLMPLHNSISYCYPGSQRYTPDTTVNGLNGFNDEMMVNINSDNKQPLLGNSNGKVDVKPELGSPVQSCKYKMFWKQRFIL